MTETPFPATRLQLAFSQLEDRLVLVAVASTGAETVLLLTRRLTAQLISGVAGVLQRSSPEASRAPAGLRDDVVLLEHQEAVARPAGPQLPSPAGRTLPAPRLVTAVRLTTAPDRFTMLIEAAAGEPVRLVLTRPELHQWLALLRRQADHAGWNLPLDATWLGEEARRVTVN